MDSSKTMGTQKAMVVKLSGLQNKKGVNVGKPLVGLTG